MNKDVMRPAGATADRTTARIGSGLHVQGEILGNEDLYIDVIDVIAGEVIVYGSVKDNVRGKGKIEIKKEGSVNGDLTTVQIIIEDGEFFKGSIEIEKSTKKEGDKNAFSRTTSTPGAGAGPTSL